MAFHTPDPKLRAVELRNARLRAQTFARFFGALWGGIVRGSMFLVRHRAPRPETSGQEAQDNQCDKGTK
jgi:hypothetical protein